MKDFTHRSLDVYRAAIEFVTLAHELCQSFPPGHASLADQLRRAATSICLNIAEGAGEFSHKEGASGIRVGWVSTRQAVRPNVPVP